MVNVSGDRMRAWVVEGRFGLDAMRLVERARPEPGPGEVLVRLGAASLNYRDVLVVDGLYNPAQPLPFVPVSDGAGEVVALGSGCAGLYSPSTTSTSR